MVAMSSLPVTGASGMLCQTASSVKKAARSLAPIVPKEAREVKTASLGEEWMLRLSPVGHTASEKIDTKAERGMGMA
jgi:hypothetical protein